MKQRRSRVSTDAEVKRIVGDLEAFLARGADLARGKRGSPGGSRSVEKIVAPVCRFALVRLRGKAPRAQKITKTVWRDLEQNLSSRLVFALAPTLRVYRRAVEALSSNPQCSRIDLNLLEMFAEFPGSLETAARLISNWVCARTELLTRLARDRREISSTFFGKKRASRVTGMRGGLSDPHGGARTVTLIEFADRNRVIYKPRACDGELLWFEALRWLNRNGLRISFQIPKTLSRKNYAWMEFLPRSVCKDVHQVRRFYCRWGAQAALAQVLGATDLHRGNWLAVGAQPILVDAEMIGEIEAGSRGEIAAQDRHLPAILRTGLLPITGRDGVGFYRGIAPFDDVMISNTAGAPHCWPRYRGAICRPSAYVKEIAAGFAAVTKMLAVKETWKGFFDDIILRIPDDRRLLLRATAQYARLLRGSLEPRHMIRRGQRWRWLLQQCCASAIDRRIGLAEARSLLCGDIPRFTTRRRAVARSLRAISARIAGLNKSLRLLRSRMRLGARQSKTNAHHQL